MEAIVLSFRGEPLRVFPLGDRALEVGSGAGCDIVVHDAAVPDRHLLVRRDGLVVVAHALGGEAGHAIPLRPGVPMDVGEHHSLTRVPDVVTSDHVRLSRTEPIPVAGDAPSRLSLLVGEGAEARRISLGTRPITIGAERGLDMVLLDRAVSRQHARIEPTSDGYAIRDLGSRNGTYVDGVRTMFAAIAAGARIRVGRTDLAVVARGETGDAREDGLVAASQAMLDVLATVERVARLEWPVLVTGESGVGKEGVARAVHARSARRSRPLVCVNAGGISESLIESELFGHEKGAFTGAQSTHRGVFEQADGGTLFFDEIGELPLAMQTRLLRVLETGDVRRVGSESHLRVDVRLVCATHRDLRAEVAAGRFREDLYYRLVRLPIAIAPLRDRPDDVPPLVAHFLRDARSETGPRAITPAAIARLRAHAWPGNVRELRNVVQAAAAFSAGVIDVRDVEEAIVMLSGRDALDQTAEPGLSMVMRKHGDNLSAAARELGVARSTLRDRLARGKR